MRKKETVSSIVIPRAGKFECVNGQYFSTHFTSHTAGAQGAVSSAVMLLKKTDEIQNFSCAVR